MKKATKVRIFGAVVLLFNLWLIGRYDLQGIPVLLLTIGFALAYEFLIVRSIAKADDKPKSAEPPGS
jgi:hypothetical protein